MCAVIGCYLKQPTEEQIETLQRLFIESQIRGRHASGLSILTNDKPWPYITPNPAEYLVEKFDWGCALAQPKLMLIGHTRYSTSDLRFNQPLQNEDVSIVHNGVITQDPPELWGRYGYSMETSNDSELLMRSVASGGEPLTEFPDASIAALELHRGGKMRWYRNAKRPLHSVKVKNGYFIMSTQNIAERAGLSGSIMLDAGTVYTPTKKTKLLNVREMIHV